MLLSCPIKSAFCCEIYSDLTTKYIGSRNILNNQTVQAAGGLYSLPSGVYHANMEDTTYLPSRWGTVVIEKSDVYYGTVTMYPTGGSGFCYRTFNSEDKTWYHDWETGASKSEFSFNHNAKAATFEATRDTGSEFFSVTITRDDGIKGSLNFSKSQGLRYLEYRNGAWNTIWSK